MPLPAVKSIRDLIHWQYAKIISESAGAGKRQYGFMTDRFKKLASGEISWLTSIREYVKEGEKAGDRSMKRSKGFHMKRILYSILLPPLAIAPVGVPLFLLGVDVSIIRDIWYLGVFVSCLAIVVRDKTPLSQIGLSKHKLGSSLLFASAWELATFLILGLIPFYTITRRPPTPVPFNQTMITPMLHFMLVGLSEETWIRGLLLKRLREWRPEGSAAVLWSSVIFVLFHVPAATSTIIRDASLLPLLMLSWSTLFIWAAGLAYITLKTGNLLGPIIVHGADDIITKVLYPLQA